MQIKRMHHSLELTPKNKADAMVRTAQIKMIFILRCFKEATIPLNAYENDLKNADITFFLWS